MADCPREFTEAIGVELLRREYEAWREDQGPARMGKKRRGELNTRRRTLRWVLHVLLGGDRANPPGDAVEGFLEALSDAQGGTWTYRRQHAAPLLEGA